MLPRVRTIRARKATGPFRISMKQIVAAISCFAISLWTFLFAKIAPHYDGDGDGDVNDLDLRKHTIHYSIPLSSHTNSSGGVPAADGSNVKRTHGASRQAIDGRILPLTAYIEEPLPKGKPLPIRTKPRLTKVVYDSVQSCRDLQNFWPVDHPKELDGRFGSNVGNDILPMYPRRNEYAGICPVDADPFLPWIHDVFTSADGQFIEFVAHNKRKCRSHPAFADDLKNLEPQVALMQSVPVRRLTESELSRLMSSDIPDNSERFDSRSKSYRYRLASIEEADKDGRETRFICQFFEAGKVNDRRDRHILGESLSAYKYNYEHENHRKFKSHPMLNRPNGTTDTHGAHNEQIWNTILHFRCPVPEELRAVVRDGSSVVNEIPSIYVDLVPIRTPVREDRGGYNPYVDSSFNPKEEWGDNHVLPAIEDSGRWSNIPVCPPPLPFNVSGETKVTKALHGDTYSRPHYLIGCLWASAAFATRGIGADVDESTSIRLLEWLTFHLYIAKFDHVYVYDNTEATTNKTSLKPVLDLFPPDRVTWIPWRHRVCNNNRPAHPNTGERSSQYAAETSCRLRYGPYTEWIAQIDTDEYLIPAGNWTDIQSWLRESVKSGKIEENTHILSFFQTRAIPNQAYMEPYTDDNEACKAGIDADEAPCLAKIKEVTFLQAYDCERTKLPKPDYGWRAQKQIYRPSFVLNHFVHYSTVTRRILEAPDEKSPPFIQRRPFERRTDELSEAFMIHAKTTPPSATRQWKAFCRGTEEEERKKCPVGVAHNLILQPAGAHVTEDGLAYNCHQHDRVQNEFVPKLRNLMEPISSRLQLSSVR